jgi:hypothetical protein
VWEELSITGLVICLWLGAGRILSFIIYCCCYSHVKGIQAFGLQEFGRHDEGEKIAREV